MSVGLASPLLSWGASSTLDIVTGGAGFLGFHLADRLSRDGRDVLIVDNFIRGDLDDRLKDLLSRPNVTLMEGDLCEPSFVNQLPSAERLFHFAAYNGTQNFYENPVGVLRHSTIPALNLAERYSKSDSLRFMAYTGSSESYAGAIKHGITDVPTPETAPLVITDITNPRWSYAAGKLHGEITTALTCQTAGIDWQVWRVHNCFGPRMGTKHVMPDFVERANRNVFELYGYEDMRTFLFVEDAIDIMVGLSSQPNANNKIINVGGIDEMTMLNLGERLMQMMNKTGDIICHPSPAGSVSRRRPDVSLLNELLPHFNYRDFEKSLQVTVESIIADIKAGTLSAK